MKEKVSIGIRTIMVIALLLIPTHSFASEHELFEQVEDVFPEEELQRLEEEINQLPIESDKIHQGGASVFSFGAYPQRKGVILVTKDKYKGIIPTGHAAIIYSPDIVVESLENGVTTGNNNWNRTRNTCYGVTVKSTTGMQDRDAAQWCYSKIGKPYNFNYLNPYTRNSFYCSQLVYAAYLDKYNINLDTSAFGVAVHPMELVNSSNTTLIYEK